MRLLTLVLAACLGSGCGERATSAAELVGAWQCYAENIDPRDIALGADEMVKSSVVTLRDDRTYEWNLAGYKTYGKWTLEDGYVTLTKTTDHVIAGKMTITVIKMKVDGDKLLVAEDERAPNTAAKAWFERK